METVVPGLVVEQFATPGVGSGLSAVTQTVLVTGLTVGVAAAVKRTFTVSVELAGMSPVRAQSRTCAANVQDQAPGVGEMVPT